MAAFDASWQELDEQMNARLSGRAAREENRT
jgi:hypothetical protein